MAVIGTMGQQSTSTSDMSGDTTSLDRQNPATAKGKVYKIKVDIGALNTPNTNAVKIIRINGSNYDVVYNQVVTNLSAGVNEITLTSPVSVLVGDMLGFWNGSPGSQALNRFQAGTGLASSHSGNVTTTTTIASWTTYSTAKFYLYADIMSVPSGAFFIFFSEAWERHDKLWKPKILIPRENYC